MKLSKLLSLVAAMTLVGALASRAMADDDPEDTPAVPPTPVTSAF